MEMSACYLYILQSELDDSFYFGVANDLDERLNRHNAGYVKSTQAKRPWKRILTKTYQTKAEALNRERKLKNLKSRKRIIEWMTKQSPSAENN
jgi:putative endonuclease